MDQDLEADQEESFRKRVLLTFFILCFLLFLTTSAFYILAFYKLNFILTLLHDATYKHR